MASRDSPSSGSSCICRCRRSSRRRSPNGWSVKARSMGRKVSTSISAAGPRRRASAAIRCTVAGSAQCTSSTSHTSGRSAARRSASAPNSRSMRSGDAPVSWDCSATRSASGRCHGICTSHIGATSRTAGTRPGSAAHSWSSALSTGRYGSLPPQRSTHWPEATRAPSSVAMKVASSVLLPTPGSPATATSCRSPARARSKACRSTASSSPRPTSGLLSTGSSAGAGSAFTCPAKR